LRGRIGEAFSKKRLKDVIAEGEARYKEKVPPGYEDEKKREGNDRFGDLIIWFQLIEKAQKEKRAITFVTADEKEDWWKEFQGKTIGPRPELVAEMQSKAGVAFQMLKPERFMAVAAEKLKQDVKPAAIKEVKEVREAESWAALNRLRVGPTALRADEASRDSALSQTEKFVKSVREGMRAEDSFASNPNYAAQAYRERLKGLSEDEMARFADIFRLSENWSLPPRLGALTEEDLARIAERLQSSGGEREQTSVKKS
jgi:hypothetical protein